ncbi:hypothetical protein RN607_00830 [Demequina capsici]|uniref:Uncharacterized protein n=1 Tax=Demequina capsici TaxID=3075620 RepID=A0AA96FCY7_9MICO|nr:hypothetical protein [Demequina sp. PMTSA13]WNM27578.1 hypothetical protein RN607_00830 [Demequina sp. PMTSA13]
MSAEQSAATEPVAAAEPSRIATDGANLLALDSTVAQALLGVFALTNVAFVVLTADRVVNPWISLMAVLLVLVAASLIVQGGPDPFPLRESWFVIGAVVLSTVMVSWNLPTTGDVGRAAWHHGADAWLLFFLAIRRRTGLAWVGFGLMAAVTAVWGATTDRGALEAALMLKTHLGTLVVASLFGAGLRRAARDINLFAELAERAAASSAEADARREIRRRRVAELVATATGPLRRIAAGGPYDEHDRTEFLAAEAALRDSVRARGLTMPAIVAATSAARRRGVDVTLLDDRGAAIMDGEVMTRLSREVTDVLDAATDGSVTVRLLPAGRWALVTIVAQSSSHGSRVELDEAGLRVESDVAQ